MGRAAPRRRTKGRTPAAPYLPDRVAGSLVAAFSTLGFAFAVYGTLWMGHPVDAASGRLVGPVLAAFFLLRVVVGIGVFRSRRWAFFALALLALYEVSGRPTRGGSGHIELLYTALRLIPAFGPRLR